MNIELYIQMIQDSHFYNLNIMQHKYTKKQVVEMMLTLKEISYIELPLKDFKGKPYYFFQQRPQ
ncbi:MAG: hypothetical protein PHQ32_03570 [Firmicutes bacterium]|nr:hypothetical protein [Bacillota bacterium]